ncbi:hypothetical protein TTHERM_00509090 (macronuclear) [Tetrahymena thermophila SB210]|uniref:Uncharacterized protein n=1 Tax=Tetrahymena thermophila (strain SB210) TaxID=312017 RepID=I7ME54_TETTS|nr:hypothetical protein TTHERM_00509090 [Tetrahymena thermophila SB210]EAR94968.2 hypothetical protein TTHERM_00509090 [Tetrahymena thermophila SB210]|eukprot:XP_001015213.2 hypothetical protein TTHERM_00509090 [Tetrahymena thermophila SB210]
MSQNVVNFSDLNENEQQKYIEFFLQNKFIFTEDQAGETFNATIKINMNQNEASSQNTSSAPQQNNIQKTLNSEQEKQVLISTKENNEQQKQIRSSFGTKLDIKKAQNQSKENSEAISQRKSTTKVNNRYSKSPIQKKIPTIQQQQPVLTNITNKLTKQQSQQINSSQQLRESLSKTKLTQSTAQDNQYKQIKKSQESENIENGQKKTEILENKKQQILEKLKAKLEEANKLAEYEEQLKQQQLLKEIAPLQQSHQNISKKGEQGGGQDVKGKDKRSSSSNNIKQQQNNHHSRINKENNKEINQDDQRSRGISFDLMQKNREFINKLQEKNKQKQQKPSRKSVSPAVTARKQHQQENSNKEESKLNTSRNGAQRRHSNIQISNQRVQTSRGRSNTQENNRSTNQIQNQAQQEKIPSTFEQIMQRQSQLINNVCNLIHDKKKGPQQPQISQRQGNYNKQEDAYQQSTSPNRSPSYINSAQSSSKSHSSLQKQTMSSIGKQNSKIQNNSTKQAVNSPNSINSNIFRKQTIQNGQNIQEINKDLNNYFEFNSFGSPNNQHQVNQQNQIAADQLDNQQKLAVKNALQNQEFVQNPQKKLNFEDEDDDEFKLYNIETKRQRKQEQLGNSIQSSRSNQNSRGNNSHKGGISNEHSHISDVSDYAMNQLNNYNQKIIINSKRTLNGTEQEQNEENQFMLTEIRAYSDPSLALRPTKMTLPQIYKCIEELYQAKFCENTLRMKMSSNGSRKNKSNQGYRSELSMQLGVQPYEISFSEFIYEYYKEKYISSKKVSEQHLINLIVSVEFYIQNHFKYSTNQILPIQTFASFIQNTYQEEELIFYLFVREMLLKYTQEAFDTNNKIYETQTIELSLEECQQILEQVYGGNEQKIIDRFMYRLTDILMQQKDSNDYNISATFFLNLALQDYIEGKNNKIYESDRQLEQRNSQKQQFGNNNQEIKQKAGTHVETLEDDYDNLQKCRSNQNLSMNSFEKWEYTFEQSFGEAPHLPSQLLGTNKKFSLFTPKNELEERIWEKMIQKISDFIELVINDNYNEFSIKEKKVKFISVEKIVTKKVNKMMGALFDQDRERWLELLCITRPSQIQLENLETILNLLQNLQKKQIDEINNSEISNFCKTILQTKELSKAIGKLLVCVLMPDNQS